MNPDSIPIDIQCNKLVDWLIDRRHCNIKWTISAEIIKEKIINALRDMPGTPEMVKLVEGSCFHFYKCKQIVELLKDTEKDSKNIFGRYSSQRMKDWQEIIKLYGQENLFLAELSSRFIRNLNYEIPSVKKQISKCQQVQEESVSRSKDLDRQINEVNRKYATECKKMGIIGEHVKNELLQLVVGLPAEFDGISKNICNLKQTIQFYSVFAGFAIDEAVEVCPTLQYIIENGNTTVYEWKYGEAPKEIIKRSQIETEEMDLGGCGEGDIDWGGDIDFGDDTGIVLEEAGDTINGNGDNGFEIVDATDLQNGDQISWDIEEISVEDVPNGSKIAKARDGIAKDEEAASLLEFISTRNLLINELRELQGFLTQRLVEAKLEEDFLTISQFQFAPSEVQMCTIDNIYEMEILVNGISSELTNQRMKDLCKILDSPRYVDRLAEDLKRQLSLVDKYNKLKLECLTEREEAAIQAQNLKPILERLIIETKEWQVLIETEVSKWYKNRKINLVGTINTL